VDDAFDFGKISVAMPLGCICHGGKPLMAVAILGWPVEKIPANIAQQILQGAQEICTQAGIH